MSDKYNVSISVASFFKIVFLLLLVALAYVVWDILVLLFIAIMLSFLIDPLADLAQKKHIHRGITVIVVYLVALGFFGGVLALFVPALVSQFTNLSVNFGSYWETFISKVHYLKALGLQYGVWDNLSNSFSAGLSTGFDTVQKLVGSIFGFIDGVASLALILVIAFYLVAEESSFRKMLRMFTPQAYREDAEFLWERVKEKLGRWLRGQLLLDLIVGVLVYIGLLVINVQYALLFALMAGIFETIPYAGPIFSAILSATLTFMQTGSLLKTVLVLLVFVVVQQSENYFLVPKIMQKTVGLNPIASILSLMIGYRLFGIVGTLLAIPTLAVVSLVWSELLSGRFSAK